MVVSKKFVVSKDEKKELVTCTTYDKKQGYDVKPKKDLRIEDMIYVNEMVIINPLLIEKLVDKKSKRALGKILHLMSLIYDEDSDNDSSNGNLDLVLNEIEKFKQLIELKYKKYMKAKDYKLLLKKLEILDNEVKLRKLSLKDRPIETSKGKGR